VKTREQRHSLGHERCLSRRMPILTQITRHPCAYGIWSGNIRTQMLEVSKLRASDRRAVESTRVSKHIPLASEA
jgi:hypothetical protein